MWLLMMCIEWIFKHQMSVHEQFVIVSESFDINHIWLMLACYQHIHFEQPTYMNLNQDLKFPPKPITKSGIIHIHVSGPVPEDLKISGRKYCTHPTVQTFGSFGWDLKNRRSHVLDPIPRHVKESQTVCRKSRGLPRLYWTSQFFSRGKHLMADELCAIHVKYIKFKKNTQLIKNARFSTICKHT